MTCEVTNSRFWEEPTEVIRLEESCAIAGTAFCTAMKLIPSAPGFSASKGSAANRPHPSCLRHLATNVAVVGLMVSMFAHVATWGLEIPTKTSRVWSFFILNGVWVLSRSTLDTSGLNNYHRSQRFLICIDILGLWLLKYQTALRVDKTGGKHGTGSWFHLTGPNLARKDHHHHHLFGDSDNHRVDACSDMQGIVSWATAPVLLRPMPTTTNTLSIAEVLERRLEWRWSLDVLPYRKSVKHMRPARHLWFKKRLLQFQRHQRWRASCQGAGYLKHPDAAYTFAFSHLFAKPQPLTQSEMDKMQLKSTSW